MRQAFKRTVLGSAQKCECADMAFPHRYFVMTDDWFSEFVYQIVADRKYISKELTDVFDHGKATVLPPWVSLRAPCLFQYLPFCSPESTDRARRIRWALSPDHHASLEGSLLAGVRVRARLPCGPWPIPIVPQSVLSSFACIDAKCSLCSQRTLSSFCTRTHGPIVSRPAVPLLAGSRLV